MESSDITELQEMDKRVTTSNRDLHESYKNPNDDGLTLGSDENSTKRDIETFTEKAIHVNNELLGLAMKLESTNEAIAQVNVKYNEGDHTVPTGDQHKKENEQEFAEKEIKKLPVEEIISKKKDVLQKLEETMQLMSTTPFRHLEQAGAPFTKEFRQSVLKIAKSYFHFKTGEVPYSVICEFRSEVGQMLSRYGIVRIMCDVLSDGLERKDYINDSKNMLNEYWFPLKNIILTLLNFSDSDEVIRSSVVDHPDVILLLVKVLRDWQKEHLNQELSDDQNKLIKWSLTILHNCARSDDNVPKLRELGVIQVVLPYLDSRNDNIRLSSISVLGLLVNEQEAELLRTHVSIFQFMIKKLGKALKKEDRKDLGWSAVELAAAIEKLARNDANKKVLVDEGSLPILVELLRTGDDKETKEAIRCLWVLSFDAGNKKKMVDEPGLVKLVYEKYLTLNGSMKHDCQGVLWSLREDMLKSQEYRSIGEDVSDLKASPALQPPSPETSHKIPGALKVQGHVMISYQWANQETIKQICQVLRCHGVPVWIDIDYMGGSTLQAMAKAVEHSFVVIMAMSQKYKDSPNTRAEAEYTFQQRKPIIPLIMQQGYRPDGWLGLILGTKFYYDFSGKYTFESRMEALLGAVKAVMKSENMNGGGVIEPEQPSVSSGVTEQPHVLPGVPSVTSKIPPKQISEVDEHAIKLWTKTHIKQWLTKYHLENSSLCNLCGEDILFLHHLKSEAPEFFYHCLESKLHLTSLLDLSRATRALSDLTVSNGE